MLHRFAVLDHQDALPGPLDRQVKEGVWVPFVMQDGAEDDRIIGRCSLLELGKGKELALTDQLSVPQQARRSFGLMDSVTTVLQDLTDVAVAAEQVEGCSLDVRLNPVGQESCPVAIQGGVPHHPDTGHFQVIPNQGKGIRLVLCEKLAKLPGVIARLITVEVKVQVQTPLDCGLKGVQRLLGVQIDNRHLIGLPWKRAEKCSRADGGIVADY